MHFILQRGRATYSLSLSGLDDKWSTVLFMPAAAAWQMCSPDPRPKMRRGHCSLSRKQITAITDDLRDDSTDGRCRSRRKCLFHCTESDGRAGGRARAREGKGVESERKPICELFKIHTMQGRRAEFQALELSRSSSCKLRNTDLRQEIIPYYFRIEFSLMLSHPRNSAPHSKITGHHCSSKARKTDR